MMEGEMARRGGAGRRRAWTVRLPALFGSALLSLLALELFFSHRFDYYLRVHGAGELSLFRHDAQLGWRGREDIRMTLVQGPERSPTIDVSTNSAGFRDIEHDPASPARRILFLGDSYTWGFEVAQNARFTDRLRAQFPALDVHNMGVIGYGTDQELLVLRRHGPRVRPSLVVVEVCHWNDLVDNRTSHNYDWAKPYFELEGGELLLRGTPVPVLPRATDQNMSILARYSYVARYVGLKGAARALGVREPSNPRDVTPDLLLAMRAEAEALGARFLVTFTADMPEIMRKLDAAGCPYISFQNVTMRGRQYNPETTFPNTGWHWNEEGHRRVAEILAEEIAKLPGNPGAGDARGTPDVPSRFSGAH